MHDKTSLGRRKDARNFASKAEVPKPKAQAGNSRKSNVAVMMEILSSETRQAATSKTAMTESIGKTTELFMLARSSLNSAFLIQPPKTKNIIAAGTLANMNGIDEMTPRGT